MELNLSLSYYSEPCAVWHVLSVDRLVNDIEISLLKLMESFDYDHLMEE